jgi:hypothetical protein
MQNTKAVVGDAVIIIATIIIIMRSGGGGGSSTHRPSSCADCSRATASATPEPDEAESACALEPLATTGAPEEKLRNSFCSSV